MRINYDCVRDVLLSLEELLVLEDDLSMNFIPLDRLCLALSDYPRHDVAYTLLMLKDANYLEVNVIDSDFGMLGMSVYGITFEGHKYLDTVRCSPIWEETKKTFKNKAIEMTVDTILLVAKTIIQSRLIS